MTNIKKLWIFNWVGGGYNSVVAGTKKEAQAEIAKEFSETKLVLAPGTLHIGTQEELAALDRSYAGMFD